VILLLAGLVPAIAAAQPVEPPETNVEQPADRGNAMADRLIEEIEMTSEQADAIRAIYASRADQREALLEEMQALRNSDASRRQRMRRMRDLRDEMQAQQAATRLELADVLDENQMREYDAFIAARRDAIREAMREGRKRNTRNTGTGTS
jgi:hypothetical protein